MNDQWAMPMQISWSGPDNQSAPENEFGYGGGGNLDTAFWDFYSVVKCVKSTIQVLQTCGSWADNFVSELAPVVQGPLLYSLNFDSFLTLESLNVVAEHLEEKIQVLGSFGNWAEKLIGCLQRFQ